MIRFHRFTVVVDLIGSAFAIVAFIVFKRPDIFGPAWTPFLQNFSVEMVGTWASVRLIDFFIEQRARSQEVRVKTLRNSRFWLNQTSNLNGRVYYRDLANLKRELKYTSGVGSQREKVLSKSEIVLYRSFVQDLGGALQVAEEIFQLQQSLRDEGDVFEDTVKRQYEAQTGSRPDYSVTSNIYPSVDRAQRILVDHVFLNDQLPDLVRDIAKISGELLRISADLKASATGDSFASLMTRLLTKRLEYVAILERLQTTFFVLEVDIREETPED